MKYFNLLFLIFTISISLNGNSQNKKTKDSNKVSSYENDQKLLNIKLVYTNKIWDSLSYILKQRPSDTIYRNSIRKQFYENRDQQLIEYQKFIFENPNSLLSAETLANLKFLYGKELTQKLFSPMSEKIKNSKLGIDISNFIQLYQNPKVNEYYIDFELANQNGEKIKLSEHLGKYTLLDF